MIRVVIADDHPPLREGIKQRLEQQPNVQVVGEAGTGPELYAVLSQEPPPDVLVLDIQMPDFEARQAIPEFKARYPKMGILIVTAYGDPRNITQMMDAEVDGYLVKQEDMGTYVRAIREIAAGRTHYSQSVFNVTREYAGITAPSSRELEVLALVTKGATTNEIALQLGISARTVETHLKRVYQKLGVNNRAAAVAKAVQLGHLTIPE